MLFPMYVMFLLVPLTAIVMFRSRIRAVKTKDIHFRYFRAMSGDGPIPDYVAIPARHFINLFELPVLFYIVCLTSMITQTNGPVMVGLAWAFVFFRYIQAFIHLTYNNVFHRLIAFASGLTVLVIMWTLLVAWSV